jgi:hypothetical protein
VAGVGAFVEAVVPEPAVVPVDAGEVDTVVTGVALTAGSNVPSKCHLPVKLLNGPPTMVLAHSMVNFLVAAS